MRRILREPLVHFLVIGALMFALYAWNRDGRSEPTRDQIVVSAGRIEQLNTIFQKTWQRPPTPDELKGVIDDFVLEEVYYRQAIAMGIDRDDTVIRRRLRQKVEFLTDDAAALVSATDEDLATYLADHPETFRGPPQYTFQQIYFNPDKHADKDGQWFKGQLDRAQSGSDEVGDPSLIADAFTNASQRVVDGTFGVGFSAALDELEVGQWQGPIRSGLGLHLIRLENRREGRLPTVEEVRPIIQREWSNAQRLATREAMNRELLKRYDVVIEWPDSTNGDRVAESKDNANGVGDE